MQQIFLHSKQIVLVLFLIQIVKSELSNSFDRFWGAISFVVCSRNFGVFKVCQMFDVLLQLQNEKFLLSVCCPLIWFSIYVAGLFIILNGLFKSSSALTLLTEKQIYTGWIGKENLTGVRPSKYFNSRSSCL